MEPAQEIPANRVLQVRSAAVQIALTAFAKSAALYRREVLVQVRRNAAAEIVSTESVNRDLLREQRVLEILNAVLKFAWVEFAKELRASRVPAVRSAAVEIAWAAFAKSAGLYLREVLVRVLRNAAAEAA